MKKQLFQSIALISMFTLGACGTENVDVTPPSIEVNSYTPVPSADNVCGVQEPTVFNVTGGDQLAFNVIFRDNISLSQYKVDIHNNFDCHGHGEGSFPRPVPPVDGSTTDWTVLDIQNISGTSSPVVRTFDVPENVTAGNYHYQIQVLDESGNDNPQANVFTLKVKNPLDDIIPEITIQEPAVTSFSVQRGETISFSGQVTDNRSLGDGGNGVLFLSYTDLSSGNTFATNEVFVFDENEDATFDFNFEYTVPLTLVTGSYRFALGANDGVRNVAEFQIFEVEITN